MHGMPKLLEKIILKSNEKILKEDLNQNNVKDLKLWLYNQENYYIKLLPKEERPKSFLSTFYDEETKDWIDFPGENFVYVINTYWFDLFANILTNDRWSSQVTNNNKWKDTDCSALYKVTSLFNYAFCRIKSLLSDNPKYQDYLEEWKMDFDYIYISEKLNNIYKYINNNNLPDPDKEQLKKDFLQWLDHISIISPLCIVYKGVDKVFGDRVNDIFIDAIIYGHEKLSDILYISSGANKVKEVLQKVEEKMGTTDIVKDLRKKLDQSEEGVRELLEVEEKNFEGTSITNMLNRAYNEITTLIKFNDIEESIVSHVIKNVIKNPLFYPNNFKDFLFKYQKSKFEVWFNFQDKDGNTLAHKLLMQLMEYNFENYVYFENNSPASFSVPRTAWEKKNKTIDMLSTLIKTIITNDNINIKNNRGKTPFHLAAESYTYPNNPDVYNINEWKNIINPSILDIQKLGEGNYNGPSFLELYDFYDQPYLRFNQKFIMFLTLSSDLDAKKIAKTLNKQEVNGNTVLHILAGVDHKNYYFVGKPYFKKEDNEKLENLIAKIEPGQSEDSFQYVRNELAKKFIYNSYYDRFLLPKDMVKLFVAMGIDLALRNKEGKKASDIAKANGNTELADLLDALEEKAKSNLVLPSMNVDSVEGLEDNNQQMK